MKRKALAERIRRGRESKGLTQVQFAKDLKVSSQQVSRWETCRQLPGRRALPRIAGRLELDLDELYELLDAAKDEDIADLQRDLNKTRSDFDYAAGQMTMFVDTYAEFHAEYQRIGDDVDRLNEKVDRIEANVAEIMRVVLSQPPPRIRRERP